MILPPMGVRNPVVIWRESNLRADTHHVNSIAEWKGKLIISAFGRKFGTLWSSAFDGYIHDVTRDRRIKGGIYHPHSLAPRGDRRVLFRVMPEAFVESSRADIRL